MMEGVESKKITTKFGNKVKFCIRAGSMTARNNYISSQSIIRGQSANISHNCSCSWNNLFTGAYSVHFM